MECLSDTKTLFRTENPFQTQRHCSKLKISFRHKDTFEVPSELTVSTGADGTNDEVLLVTAFCIVCWCYSHFGCITRLYDLCYLALFLSILLVSFSSEGKE